MSEEMNKARSNPIALAAGAKGSKAFLHRVGMIGRRYGVTPAKLERAVAQFVQLVGHFGSGATFPTPAIVVERHPQILRKYQAQGIEFAVHGYRHIDYSQLGYEDQLSHLRQACRIFAEAGVKAIGFRSPYLQWDSHLERAIEAVGLSYVSNQSIVWKVLDLDSLTEQARANYARALGFYQGWDADRRLSLPTLSGALVNIPVCLPDDEILLDRLDGAGRGLVESAWRSMLLQTHQRGELFTIQLHPERIGQCADDLSRVLAKARALTPSVWMARLDEIAVWWRDRAAATAEVREIETGSWQVSVSGPPATTVLARGVELGSSAEPWFDGYFKLSSMGGTVRAARRPVIGLSPRCPQSLGSFLRQQGYICEANAEEEACSIYVDEPTFVAEDEIRLLSTLEGSDKALVRLGRWPGGARSALCVSGDLDALTLWDYGLRFLGK
jgi:hypothetical protein